MATQRILYSQATQTGKTTAQTVNSALEALAEMRRLKALMDRAVFGSDYAALAAELGGGITAAQAQDTWTIIANALMAMDVDALRVELSRLDQG